jgi:hypothetical protein
VDNDNVEIPPIRGSKLIKNTEKEDIPRIQPDSTEVILQKAITSHWVSLIRYFGGIGIISVITLASLYVIVFDNASQAYGDAVKLLFLIAGAIVGSIYASSSKD